MFLLDILTHDKQQNENIYDLCGEEFGSYEDLIAHARHVHHDPVMKCHECG